MIFPFKYQVRFTTVSDGNNFADELNAYIEWIIDSDDFNRAFISCKHNLYSQLLSDERVQQFNLFKNN